jgi:hypothetical protein
MDEWKQDFEWLRVRHLVKDAFGREQLPDVNAILFLIGVQEMGRPKASFTKEEKQDLMHIAVCRLLEFDGYYEFAGRDQDGWPHFRQIRQVPVRGVEEQEELLKAKIIQYFQDMK